MSQDPLHTPAENSNEWLNRSFDEWDAGEPAANLWTELDESLSMESVWSRVGQSLTTEEHLEDRWIADSHESWNPQPEKDGWAKLNDAISLEQVWVELNETLGQPVATRIPVWKLLAACVVALFMTRRLNDMPALRNKATTPQSDRTIAATAPEVELSAVLQLPEPATADHSSDVQAVHATVGQRRNAPLHPQAEQPIVQESVAEVVHPEDGSMPGENLADADPEAAAITEEVPVDPLDKRLWSYPTELLHLDRSLFSGPAPIQHWTIQAGTQLSILQERDQASLTSTMPRFGMAADVSYRHRIGSLQLIHALGMSQYSQGAGKYINGRYCNTNQLINTLQFSSSFGYSYKRFTFYGGIILSRMLSGLEQKNDAVTQVYNFNQVQPGFTGGIDFRLATLRTGQTISFGSQYQWLPSVNTRKTSFENIQGIRFQAKFSF